jgi:hypothetical protein
MAFMTRKITVSAYIQGCLWVLGSWPDNMAQKPNSALLVPEIWPTFHMKKPQLGLLPEN